MKTCPHNQVFCDYLGNCNDLFGMSCEDNGWCCAPPTTSTTVSTVTSTTTVASTTEPPPDCDALCGDDSEGLVGECCSQYHCDCSDKSPVKCSDDEKFCDFMQICVDLMGQDCAGSGWCCQELTTTTTTSSAQSSSSSTTTETTTTTTTTAEPLDCVSVCADQDTGVAGQCCETQFCDCEDKLLVQCSGDEVYCEQLKTCAPMLGQECQSINWCCYQ